MVVGLVVCLSLGRGHIESGREERMRRAVVGAGGAHGAVDATQLDALEHRGKRTDSDVVAAGRQEAGQMHADDVFTGWKRVEGEPAARVASSPSRS